MASQLRLVFTIWKLAGGKKQKRNDISRHVELHEIQISGSINKASLAPSHARSFTYGLRLLSPKSRRAKGSPQTHVAGRAGKTCHLALYRWGVDSRPVRWLWEPGQVHRSSSIWTLTFMISLPLHTISFQSPVLSGKCTDWSLQLVGCWLVSRISVAPTSLGIFFPRGQCVISKLFMPAVRNCNHVT